MFFTDDFFELTPESDAHTDPELQKIIDTLKLQPNVQDVWDYSVAECQCIVKLLPDCHAAHMDLAGALYREAILQLLRKAYSRRLIWTTHCPDFAITTVPALPGYGEISKRCLRTSSMLVNADSTRLWKKIWRLFRRG